MTSTALALLGLLASTSASGARAPERPILPSERRVGVAYTTWHRTVPWTGVWGTPELGFYRSDDRRVIRQHAEWLAGAGVDFVFVDWSNDLNYTPGVTRGRPDFDMIEGATDALFDEYSRMKRRPQIAVMIGCPGETKAVTDGRLTRKADQVYRHYVRNDRFRSLLETYLGKPLLIVYAGTPCPWQGGLPPWTDPRFTVRWMTGFLTQQPELLGPGGLSRYGYWSWEDRGAPTHAAFDGRPEAMTISAAWRGDAEHPTPGRAGGETFREAWTRAREVGPRYALVTTWNEWITGEQPSTEVSKDLEPSKASGRFYLALLGKEVARFKAR